MRKFTPFFGLTGSGIILLFTIITAIPYHGTKGEAYSLLNHFISELGEIGVSQFAPLFNIGLISGGILLALFMLGLGLILGNIAGYIAAGLGVITGLACSLVGAFPMNNMAIHVPVALTFFRTGLVTVSFFTIIILFDDRKIISSWMAIPGFITALAFAAFLYLPGLLNPNQGTSLSVIANRPSFWLTPYLEWLVFLSVLFWVMSMAIYLMRVNFSNKTR